MRQHIARLAEHGVLLHEMFPRLGGYPPRSRVLRPAWLAGSLIERLPQLAAAATSDIVLFQRELVTTLPTLEHLTRRPRVVDIDDAVHLHRGGRAARHLAALADLVIVGNAWLAEIWRQWARAVEIVPTAVDTEHYAVAPPPAAPTIGWIGTSGNLPYLADIAPALAAVAERFPGTTIAICCDRRPRLGGLAVRWVPWSAAVEKPFLASISIGIMPLRDGLWERGKCSFKLLQYMAAGRPCVVSPVGMNRDILSQAEIGRAAATPAEWREALSGLIADPAAAAAMGMAGRRLAETRYSAAVVAPRLAALLRRVA